MKHIVAFAASNAKKSINKELVSYASSLMENVEVSIIDINDFELPIYGVDLEEELGGQPQIAHDFYKNIQKADGVLISFSEHNGVYTTAFKNLFDWVTRVKPNFFESKPVLLMATSPGPRGGKTVLQIAKERFPFHDADIIGIFSLPSFYDNFSEGKIVDTALESQLKLEINKLEQAVLNEVTESI